MVGLETGGKDSSKVDSLRLLLWASWIESEFAKKDSKQRCECDEGRKRVGIFIRSDLENIAAPQDVSLLEAGFEDMKHWIFWRKERLDLVRYWDWTLNNTDVILHLFYTVATFHPFWEILENKFSWSFSNPEISYIIDPLFRFNENAAFRIVFQVCDNLLDVDQNMISFTQLMWHVFAFDTLKHNEEHQLLARQMVVLWSTLCDIREFQ